MEKGIKKLFNTIGITEETEIKSIIEAMSAEDETVLDGTLESILAKIQEYARPFIEPSLREAFNNERGTLKARYNQEFVRALNKEAGSPLTNKEMEDISKNPDNAGKTYDQMTKAIIAKIKQGSDMTAEQFNQMLAEKDNEIEDIKAKLEQAISESDNKLNAYKKEQAIKTKVLSLLPKYTDKDPEKMLDIYLGHISKSADISTNEKGELVILEKGTENKLKVNGTKLATLEGLMEDTTNYFDFTPKSRGNVEDEPNKANVFNIKGNSDVKTDNMHGNAAAFMKLLNK